MARTSVGIIPVDPVVGIAQVGLTLDRYCDLMVGMDRITRCMFNGIDIPTPAYDVAGMGIVTQSQRNTLAMYLYQAEVKREEFLGYHIGYKWIIHEHHDCGVDNPYMLNMKYLRSVGYPTLANISIGEAVNYGVPPFNAANPPTDPITITVATTVSIYEILVMYPGENVCITPSSIVDNGDGTVTISIPRCRLVHPDYNDDRDDHIGYYDADPYLMTVDIRRQYADVSLGADFVWTCPPGTSNCVPGCQTACPIISGHDAYTLSIVHAYPASYSSGTWTTGCWSYSTKPTSVRFSYQSGRVDFSDELYTARLAHTLMPRPPCSGDMVKQQWIDDREILPRTYTSYGSMRGAMETWMSDRDRKVGHGGMFPGMHV